MRTTKRWTFVTLAALALVGGSMTAEAVDAKEDSTSLVFGYVDVKDAPASIDWVSLKRSGGRPGYYRLGLTNGVYCYIGVEPGSYQVEKSGGVKGGLIFGNAVEFEYGTRGRDATALRVGTPGVYFMGAHRFVAQDGARFAVGRFEMQAVQSPTEREVLERLIELLESDKDLKAYTREIGFAKRRLAELSQ